MGCSDSKPKVEESTAQKTTSDSNYPPTGLPESIQKLPEWIRLGCGNEEYYCEEKGAVFKPSEMPEECPDLSAHNNFFSEVMKANPELYGKLRGLTTSQVHFCSINRSHKLRE